VKCARCGLDATLVLEGQAFSIGLTCYMIGKGESIGLLACKTFDIKPQVT
jgi:hypothetical protein